MYGTLKKPKIIKIDDLIEIDRLSWEWLCDQAKTDFWSFRVFMNPKMLEGWWQKEVARELQRFVNDLLKGKAPKLLFQAPRQVGKSLQVIDCIAWAYGQRPDLKTIFTSYSERLGIRANLRLQRMLDSPKYKQVFPNVKIPSNSAKVGSYQRNHQMIEFIGTEGSFRNTTVGGRITGESLDLGVVDDPVKGREEANSELIREKTWEWLTDDFLGCFSRDAGLLAISTRYHVDDPTGRMIERIPDLRVLKYKAIATEDEKHRKKGAALFPELKPVAFYDNLRKILTTAGFEAIYQQSPIIVGGGLFPIEKFEIVKAPPTKEIKRSVRYWDKAGTSGGGAFTAGVLMHQLNDNRIFVSDVRRGQWSALEREQRIKQTSQIDKQQCRLYEVVLEQEPGSGGKESVESSIRNLAGYTVSADKVTGDKESRAEPYAAQVQAGNVLLLAADWNRSYLDEHEQFPSGKYKDQVDSSTGAFNKLTLGHRYDSSLRWV